MSKEYKKLKQTLSTSVPGSDISVILNPKKFDYPVAKGIPPASEWATFQVVMFYPSAKVRKATSPQFELRVINDTDTGEFFADVYVRNVKNDETGKKLKQLLDKAGLDVKGKRKPRFYYDATIAYSSASKMILSLARVARNLAKAMAVAYGINDKTFTPNVAPKNAPKKLRKKKPVPGPTPEKVRKNPNPPTVISPGVLVAIDLKQGGKQGSGIAVTLYGGGVSHIRCKILEYSANSGGDLTGKLYKLPRNQVTLYDGYETSRLTSEIDLALKQDPDRNFKPGDYIAILYKYAHGSTTSWYTTKITSVQPGHVEVENPMFQSRKKNTHITVELNSRTRRPSLNEIKTFERRKRDTYG